MWSHQGSGGGGEGEEGPPSESGGAPHQSPHHPHHIHPHHNVHPPPPHDWRREAQHRHYSQVAAAYPFLILLAYSSTLTTAEAWYDRDDSPELYGCDDRDSSPEQGYGYGGNSGYNGYRSYNGVGGYNGYNGNGGYNGYGANSDIEDVSIELSRHQLQPQSSCDASIPVSSFPGNYLCVDCKTNQDAETKMNWPGFAPVGSPYLLFADKTFEGKAISYTDIIIGRADKCKIEERVQVWSCKPNKVGRWTCSPMGFCTAGINMVAGVYKPDAVPTCTCVNPLFEDKHVCSSCTTDAQALAFVQAGKPPTGGNSRDIFSDNSGPFTYQDDKEGKLNLCLVTNPTEVMSWKCNPKSNTAWKDCQSIGYCTYIRSKLADGHFEYTYKACYKVHPNKIWDDKDCPTVSSGVVIPDTTATCMLECKKSFKADAAKGCNAFNFKPGAGSLCTLKRCLSPYPAPIANPDNYGAYYQDVVL